MSQPNMTSIIQTGGQSNFQHMNPQEIAASFNNRRREQLRLQGLDYEPEEQPIYRFDVRELNKAKDIGQLFLSTYKIFFMPNSVRDPQKARYFSIPYGVVYGYTA